MTAHDEVTFKAVATFICKHRNIYKCIETEKLLKKITFTKRTKNVHADPLTYAQIRGPNFQQVEHPPNTEVLHIYAYFLF